MSARILTACAAALVLAALATAQNDEPIKIKRSGPAPDLIPALHKGNVKIKGEEAADRPLFEVLATLSKRHGVTFVVMEEQFRAKQVTDLKEKKSPLKFETKGLTLHAFLNVWLAGFEAMYRARPDYLEIVPLGAAAENLPALGRPAAAQADALATLLDKLHGEEVQFEGNIGEIPLFELLLRLSKRHDLAFTVNDESFRADGINDIREARPRVSAPQVRGLTLHQFLSTVLESTGATYVVKGKTVEVVTPTHAARVTRSALDVVQDGPKALREPLVSAVFAEKPLAEAVASVAGRYDLSVVVSPQAGDGRVAPVTARLLNVPADKALELLALQADLRVVRKGAAFLVTSREHADELFAEELKKTRARREAEKVPPAGKTGEPQPPK
jgi:hypothetical protein